MKRGKGGFSMVKALREWLQALEHLLLPPQALCELCRESPPWMWGLVGSALIP